VERLAERLVELAEAELDLEFKNNPGSDDNF
jgi:hypothetical protein